MITVGFIGVYDKIDFMLYLGKMISLLNKKILIIDSTEKQKARYIVPAINPTRAYMTEFEQVDVAVGFKSYEDVKRYIGISETENLDYDVVLIDADSQEGIENFELKECYLNYFVTSFDLYSLKKGLEILNNLREPLPLTKVLFSKEILKEENDYLDYLSVDSKVMWNENIIYFPLDSEDQNVIIENQRNSRVRIKKLSQLFRSSLYCLLEQIMANEPKENLKRAFKSIEKEV